MLKVVPLLIAKSVAVIDISLEWPLDSAPAVHVRLEGDYRDYKMQLDFSSDSISLFQSFRGWQFPHNRRVLITSVNVMSRNRLMFELSSSHPFPMIESTTTTDSELMGKLGIGFDSVFAQTVGNAILVPYNDDFRFISNGVRLSDYCVPDSFAYVPTVRSGFVRGHLTIDHGGRVQRGPDVDIKLDLTADRVFLPRGTFELLSMSLLQLQIDEDGDEVPVSVYRPFIIEMNNVRILIDVEDYTIIRDGRRRLNLGVTEDGIVLGRNVLRNIGIIIDYQTRQYGFCDPIH